MFFCIYAYDREDYENKPFELLLFRLGGEVESEPCGRWIFSLVWDFNTESINGTSDYVRIVKRPCEIAGQPYCVTDFADLEDGEAWLEYKIGGKAGHWPIEVNDGWADTLTLSYIMDELEERNGCRFNFKDNGQTMTLFYLDEAAANRLNELSNGALKPVVPE